MKIDFVTLFPDMFTSVMDASVLGRAAEKGLVAWRCVNPRDFSTDKHRKVDDRPFGGGPGMVMMAEPLRAALRSVKTKTSRTVLLSPQGARFDDQTAARLSQEKHLIFVCGHYEGIDERAQKLFDEELSIGDYVLTGGELPAMVVADAVIRRVPGVLKKEDATTQESFVDGLLDFPQYTRPRVWRGEAVPEILFSGDHRRIAEWRQQQARAATARKRPDLMARTNSDGRRNV